MRVTVVKLKAENRHAELGEGTLHSRLVKKLQINCRYRPHGLDDKPPPEQRFPRRKFDERRPRVFYTGKDGEDHSQSRMRESDGRTKKPPCVFFGQENHGIWNCQKFQQINESRKKNASVVCPLRTVERTVIAVVSVALVDASSLAIACCMIQIITGSLVLFFLMRNQIPHGRGQMV